MSKDNPFHIKVLRWVIIAGIIGTTLGGLVGWVNDSMDISLPLGIGMGLIFGFVLAVQHHQKE
jgi:F0F1-type ATP synthase assembly protein I